MAMLDSDIVRMQDEYHAGWRECRRWIVVERNGMYEVHEHTVDGVAPPSAYLTRRLAAARLLQLMHTGPVAPQTHPEDVCISTVALSQDAAV